MKSVDAGVLAVAYLDSGPADGVPVVLAHGFPYDVHTYDEVCERLVASGCRVITPYLRGYGPTRFLAADTLRSGQQAVLAHDLLALLDALGIERAILGGYDWGGRAACIVAALWPERVLGLVSCNGYNIQDIARGMEPLPPEEEHELWYQYYFHSERGRAGLSGNTRALTRLLWRLWSPTWQFDESTFTRSADAFENPDFVPVVIHSYRHRFGLVAGDASVEATERALAKQPAISVPTVVIDGVDDGVSRCLAAAEHGRHFSGPFSYLRLEGVGHNPPQEAPAAFADAVLGLR